jgi:two-component system nitrogen regulation response regulator NtrX
MLAAYIHAQSKRKTQPFIKVNCAAITDTLFETEFFGHQKGSFTGAIKDKKGKFELADGGTLFLDEVGELPLNQQTKLLRVLEDSEFYRVGSEKAQKSDVRIISATNQDLDDMINDKSFREDLFYRLNVVNFHIPRLKDRPADILLLGGFFLKSIAEQEGMPEKLLSQEAANILQNMDFPGNIRELKNMMHKLFFVSSGSEITERDIRLSTNFKKDNMTEISSTTPTIFEETRSLSEAKKNLEKEYIIRQLQKHDGNVSVTALALNILPNNLFRKIKELGIK